MYGETVLIIVESKLNGNELTYALFESYTSHGDKMIETSVRMNGLEHTFMAVKTVMTEVGILFNPIPPCHFLELLKALGAFYNAGNSDIKDCVIMSQMCH